jgi:hypothetical protein
MGVSALRVAACAGVLMGALMLGSSAVGVAFADPGGAGHSFSDEQAGNGVRDGHPGVARLLQRILGEHRSRVHSKTRSAPRVKIGSEPVIGVSAGETNVATFPDGNKEPAEEVAPGNGRGAEPEAADAGDGTGLGGTEPTVTAETVRDASDYVDNTVVRGQPEVDRRQAGLLGYPLPYYLRELRRGGGDWWNAERIVSRLRQAFMPYLSAPRKPEPPAPGPAFRGGAPEPEPVLDASGGVAGGGSDYQATGFGGAPVLSAPIVAVPIPPPAAARFPSFPPAAPSAPPAPPAPSLGSAAARGPATGPGSTAAELTRATGAQEQTPAATLKAMSGQPPRQGFTDYLRSPGLAQLAGAALPGVAGILLITFGGGVVGYRQASAGRMIRSGGAARYLP